MSKREELLAILSCYMQVLPPWRPMDERGVDLYISLIEDIPANRVERAFKYISQTAKRFPAPAEVIEAAELVMTDEEREARRAAIQERKRRFIAAQNAAYEARMKNDESA